MRCLNLSNLDGVDPNSWGKNPESRITNKEKSITNKNSKLESRNTNVESRITNNRKIVTQKEFEDFKQEIVQKLKNLQESKPIEKADILFAITDPSEYNAVKFAIAKCMNLFKANKYDSPSSSMKSIKENWEEITKREKWNKKEDKK